MCVRACVYGCVCVHVDPLRPHGLWPSRLFCTWNLPGKNTGLGCSFLLQGIFPTQGLNPHLLPVSPALAGGFFTTCATCSINKQILTSVLEEEAHGSKGTRFHY